MKRLTQILAQQQVALVERTGALREWAPASPALQAMTWHQRFFNETPAGRELRRNWQRQVILETKAMEATRARYQKEQASMIARGAAAALPKARELLIRWFGPLTRAIMEEQKRILNGARGVDRKVYGPYLLQLEPEQLAVLTMHSVINAIVATEEAGGGAFSSPGQARVTRLSLAIGKAVEAQVNLDKLQVEAHKHNLVRREVKELYQRGWRLRQLLQQLQAADPEASLSQEQWDEWHSLGAALQDMGEVMPLDPHEWYSKADFEERLRRLSVACRVPREGSTTFSKVSAAARRVLQGEEVKWHSDILAKVGVALMKLLADSCFIDVRRPGGGVQSVPAFWHKLELGHDGSPRGIWKKYGLLCAHESVMSRIRPHEMVEVFMPQYLPMLIQPVPWLRNNMGGHLTLRNTVMRIRGSRLQQEMLDAADAEWLEGRGPGLSKVYDALNALSSTPWSVNPDVFKVVESIWAWGGGLCDIPPKVNVPMKPDIKLGFRQHRDHSSPGQLLFYGATRADVRARRSEIARSKKKNKELHSLRCDMEYKLAIAREFSKEERFFFPHNVDFRGRAYPMHPHLNHLGSDLARGLLQFADGRPLGEHGMFWLHVQAANLWGQGVDKLPLWGRYKWVQDNLAQIVENAHDPFQVSSYLGSSVSGDGVAAAKELKPKEQRELLKDLQVTAAAGGKLPFWWKAENPFQFLATCVEISNANASGDPARYISRLPVHMDGSCNGLQHYAALARDLTGGFAVNLCPSDKPQDVYTEISSLVKKRVAADAAEGVPEAQALVKHTTVDRKLVKQTVMTSVYGVTFVGARAQIGNRLKERGFEDSPFMYKVSCYSAKVILDCLHEMFKSAKDTMHWLSECARIIAKDGHGVMWHTPLGLPVVQPYRRKDKQHVRTLLQRLVLVENNDDLPIMKQRQRTAFPPNYIHSIDSSHMMLTVIACKDEGLDFAGVHDSFWTHAGSVERMNELLRDKFIELHSQPLLEQLLEEFQKLYPGIKFPPVPKRGDLNLDQLREATYFFS
ncbi:DNA-directed RNA polymerase chloroplastic mitochondrial [Micractinium conductrix]|uniref:DNA-directed RNA polymerase n=1 Tax=Micractinium conductrix TaxID=554055 RepID=A0A2P6VL77_9CHLO|nr:DNA-directed RNA polymerase chloroplastic mitochondrial [Micractinium conductrix]|eukprot:PSC74843.1 DNA-directed RNA polymerase chloroplastic mitochondrial [Micractinium conductrix]